MNTTQPDWLALARALAAQLDTPSQPPGLAYSCEFEVSFFVALEAGLLSDTALEHATAILCAAQRRHAIAAALKTERLSDRVRAEAEAALRAIEAVPGRRRWEKGEIFRTETPADLYDDIEPSGQWIGVLQPGTLVQFGGGHFGKLYLIDSMTGRAYFVRLKSS